MSLLRARLYCELAVDAEELLLRAVPEVKPASVMQTSSTNQNHDFEYGLSHDINF